MKITVMFFSKGVMKTNPKLKKKKKIRALMQKKDT